jgi:hypothetical protein
MTKQEIFNRVWAHAQTMTERAVVKGKIGGESCRYRSPTGPCLIGALIPDELYNPEFEGLPASQLLDDGLLDYEPFKNIPGRFLDSLQACHDNAETMEEVRENLRAFAHVGSLTVPDAA